MVLTLNFPKMNCVAVIVWLVCGERMNAITIVKPIDKLAMLFQWMYSISINLWKQHSLKLNAFALLTRNVLSPTREYSCNRILYIVLKSSLSAPCISKQIFFLLPFLLFVLNFVHSTCIGPFSSVLCIEHWASRSLTLILLDVFSFVLLWIKMLTAYLKKRINAVHRSVCMFVAAYVPQYFGCF